MNASHVALFVTVGPPPEEPLGGTGLALDEGSNRERHMEKGARGKMDYTTFALS